MTARFLSPAWFALVEARQGPFPDGPAVVLEQVVEGGPDGTVVYRVELAGDARRVVWPVGSGAAAPDLRLTADWATAVALAQGELSAQRALMEGRLRVKGDPNRLVEAGARATGTDTIPESVRAETDFGPFPATG